MPCSKRDHEHLRWPQEGAHEFVIEACETHCGWCKYQTKNANNLRAHARRHLANENESSLRKITIVKGKAGRKRVQMERSRFSTPQSRISFPAHSVSADRCLSCLFENKECDLNEPKCHNCIRGASDCSFSWGRGQRAQDPNSDYVTPGSLTGILNDNKSHEKQVHSHPDTQASTLEGDRARTSYAPPALIKSNQQPGESNRLKEQNIDKILTEVNEIGPNLGGRLQDRLLPENRGPNTQRFMQEVLNVPNGSSQANASQDLRSIPKPPEPPSLVAKIHEWLDLQPEAEVGIDNIRISMAPGIDDTGIPTSPVSSCGATLGVVAHKITPSLETRGSWPESRQNDIVAHRGLFEIDLNTSKPTSPELQRVSQIPMAQSQLPSVHQTQTEHLPQLSTDSSFSFEQSHSHGGQAPWAQLVDIFGAEG